MNACTYNDQPLMALYTYEHLHRHTQTRHSSSQTPIVPTSNIIPNPNTPIQTIHWIKNLPQQRP